MDANKIMKIFEDTAYVRMGGSAEELKAAQYLQEKCAEMGLNATIEDFEVDIACGKIIAMIVVGEARLFGFGKCEEYVIPWDKIHCIGEDTILVKLEPSELRCCLREPRDKKKQRNNKM